MGTEFTDQVVRTSTTTASSAGPPNARPHPTSMEPAQKAPTPLGEVRTRQRATTDPPVSPGQAKTDNSGIDRRGTIVRTRQTHYRSAEPPRAPGERRWASSLRPVRLAQRWATGWCGPMCAGPLTVRPCAARRMAMDPRPWPWPSAGRRPGAQRIFETLEVPHRGRRQTWRALLKQSGLVGDDRLDHRSRSLHHGASTS